MKYFITAAALAALAPGAFSLTMNTPASVVECQPQLLSWTDGTAPYYLSIIPGGQPSAPPIKSFDTASGNSMTWLVDIAAGTPITFALKDSTGTTAYTDIVNIQKGTDSSCRNGGPPPPASAASAPTPDAPSSIATEATDATTSGVESSGTVKAATGAASPTTAVRAASSSVASSSSSSATSASASASASGAATTNTSGAGSRFRVGAFGLAGLLGILSVIVL